MTARKVATISVPGRHADGNGLYLVVEKSGAKRWAFLFRWDGKLKEMGLGGVTSVTLADARVRADEARRVLAGGRNPIEVRRAVSQPLAAHPAVPTFGEFMDGLIEEISPGFRNPKHIQQWRNTMRDYAAPLRSKLCDEVDTTDVLAILQPIWTKKAETASRVRGRLERVLDAAKAKGLRTGENPARLRGHLDALLPKQQRLQRGHHAAMPYQDVPKLVATLSENGSVSALCLLFVIFTAARTGEVLGATWKEIDLANSLWVIPAGRMKAGREHRVPLTEGAVTVLDQMTLLRPVDDVKGDAYVFPGARKGRPLSQMTLLMMLRRTVGDGATTHGFRSSFRDWAGEETSFPREVAEQALAHSVGDQTERAYRRGDALEKRRALMAAWETHLRGPGLQTEAMPAA